MLSYLQSLAIVLVSVGVALTLTAVLSRWVNNSLRERSNLVNSSQMMMLGTIYGVLLGFMLSDAWIAYQRAGDDVHAAEAAAALTIYRNSSLLPSSCALPLQNAAEEYVRTVITVEWPSMTGHQADFRGSSIVAGMWSVVDGCLARMEVHRRRHARASSARWKTLHACREARMEDYNGHLPLMMWCVLLFGATAVITASTLLGNENKYVHALHVASLTVLISVSLLTISDLDRPFDGGTRVDSTAFSTVSEAIERPSGF